MRRHHLLFALAPLAVLFTPRDAQACGGCFHNPGDVPTVVTDHRMIFSVSPTQTTLYDQIKYTGDPAAFAWVLPIAGTAKVGLSADIVFTTLDQQTQTTVLAAPVSCPPPPPNCVLPASAGASPPPPAPPPPGTVNVISEEVVGPYQTVQLAATTPNALEDWLAQNGFDLPSDVKPTVDAYVAGGFDFLAMKLLPNKGVQDMRPVRVTTTGSSLALPLRMVAAGTGANVGVTLWIVAEGRYEPQNFPWFRIEDKDLVWDYAANKSNYTILRADHTSASGGKAWEIESSLAFGVVGYESTVTRGYTSGSVANSESIAQQDYLPVKDSGGTVTETAVQVRADDMEALFHGIPNATTRVTRIRADLAHAALTEDLVLTASSDQAVLTNIRQSTTPINFQCPSYSYCDGSSGSSGATSGGADGTSSGGTGAGSGGGGETFSCATSPEAPSSAWLAPLGFLGFALARSRRRSR
jgi:MYXO-CTERM domain-containing protein